MIRQRVHGFFKSLRVRFCLILALVGLSACTIIRYAILANYEKRAVEVREEEMKEHLDTLGRLLLEEDFFQNASSQKAKAQLSLMSDIYEGRILVVNPELQFLWDSEGELDGTVAVDDSIRRSMEGEEQVQETLYDETTSTVTIVYPVTENGLIRGALWAQGSTRPVVSMMRILTTKANRIQLIVILAILFFAMIASEILLRPFDRITRAINDIGAGYSDEPISVPDYLETEQITGAFNRLQSRVKALDDSRQEFVSNVSHELKTPLTSIKVLSDTLLSQPDAPTEMYRDFLKDISEEIDREDRIINDLLTLVKADKQAAPLNITQVNINELTEIVMKRLRPIARQRNVDLTMESTREIHAEVDEVKFSMVVMNLVENAIKYNREGGWVRVELDADPRYFTVKVSDSGIGMPEEELAHIYDRFYRVDKSRSREIGGTGLGLSVVRQAVTAHKGEIEASSTEGVGTIFTVRLPVIHS